MPSVARLFRIGTPSWETRIAERNPINNPTLTARSAERALRRLRDNLRSFWIERPWSSGSDGLLSELCEVREGNRRLNLILLTRYLWFAARLAGEGNAKAGELARQSYELLRAHLLDEAGGGFFWEADIDAARASKSNKHLYGQAFAMFALSEYALASSDPAPAALARETFDLLERHAHDDRFGGYAEYFSSGWRPMSDRGYLGWDGDLKLVNTHLHLLEAFTTLHEHSPSERLRTRTAELMEILAEKSLSRRHGVAFDRYTRAWAPMTGRKHKKISYGHELECIHLILAACSVLGVGPEAHVESCRRRFSYSMRYGFDFVRGGFFKHGQVGRPANQRGKVWWVQAETLLASLAMHRITGERCYLSVFEAILDWISSYQADWTEGEWHQEIDGKGRIRGKKISRWKGPYHTGRAILGCLDELAALRASDGAPANSGELEPL